MIFNLPNACNGSRVHLFIPALAVCVCYLRLTWRRTCDTWVSPRALASWNESNVDWPREQARWAYLPRSWLYLVSLQEENTNCTGCEFCPRRARYILLARALHLARSPASRARPSAKHTPQHVAPYIYSCVCKEGGYAWSTLLEECTLSAGITLWFTEKNSPHRPQ